MPRYYRLSPAVWNEPWDDDTRLLAFYVLTCPHRTTEGLFRLPLPYVEADIGWPRKRIEKTFGKLEEAGFLRRHEDVVLIRMALKYQSPQNTNQTTAAIRALETVPETPLDEEFGGLCQRFSERLVKALPEHFGERFGNALALTPSLTQPPPPTGTGGGDRIDEKLYAVHCALTAESDFDPADVDGAVALLRKRLVAGEPPTSLVAWTEAVVRSMAEKREAAARADEPKREVFEGEWHTYDREQKRWVPDPEVTV